MKFSILLTLLVSLVSVQAAPFDFDSLYNDQESDVSVQAAPFDFDSLYNDQESDVSVQAAAPIGVAAFPIDENNGDGAEIEFELE